MINVHYSLFLKMKITTRILEEILSNIAGDDLPPLLALLRDKKNVSEFKLAEKLNISVNQVRNMLYRLYKYNMVSFIRKKDKKKGWYIYYWTLNMNQVKEAINKFKKKQLKEFEDRLSRESEGNFFVCPNRCMRLKFDTAMEHEFRCQECGDLMFEQDNKRTIENIKERIIELKEELKLSEAEIEEAKKKPKRVTKKKKAAKKTKKKKAVKKKTAKKKPKPKSVRKKAVKKSKKKAAKKKSQSKKSFTKKKSNSKLIKRPVKKFLKKFTKK